MAKFIITGGKKLQGEIFLSGNKNAALPILAATVLTDAPCVIHNVPKITDVATMLALLVDLGKTIEHTGDRSVHIKNAVSQSALDKHLVEKLRASILFLGPLLARTGNVSIGPPGGCVIGRRAVGTHFEALTAMGATIVGTEDHYEATLAHPRPAQIFLDEVSVTATENAMMCAAAIPGETVIDNAACEPHVADLAEVLRKMGAKITGEGTNRLTIHGQNNLGGFEHRIVPDHIEAGTMIIASACTQGQILIRDVRPAHLRPMLIYLQRMGVHVQFCDDTTLEVFPPDLKAPSNKIQTRPWPGFPTDLMSPMIVLATQAHGMTLCHDWMYESRMFFVDKLIAMGANITQCDPHRVLVLGPTQLRAQKLSSPDIRAGIALVIAGLVASGTSTIDNVELIDRGYENLVQRLRKLGADIDREE
ncbi:MAG: UDP-N-acetylglucosamine 1-carboxyvinyltransferase [candidate division KSB1 bacterium]|nr:UDP-N-acetylglucosamine 1-carboxyvinyltransferase [candidate division KSB1 bacterium]